MENVQFEITNYTNNFKGKDARYNLVWIEKATYREFLLEDVWRTARWIQNSKNIDPSFSHQFETIEVAFKVAKKYLEEYSAPFKKLAQKYRTRVITENGSACGWMCLGTGAAATGFGTALSFVLGGPVGLSYFLVILTGVEVVGTGVLFGVANCARVPHSRRPLQRKNFAYVRFLEEVVENFEKKEFKNLTKKWFDNNGMHNFTDLDFHLYFFMTQMLKREIQSLDKYRDRIKVLKSQKIELEKILKKGIQLLSDLYFQTIF